MSARPALVSCIVPVRDGEPYLRETLESVFAQTWPALEVIVADDGSTDGTGAICAAYGERLRYTRQANAGPAAARNLGLAASRGSFVAFLDADDVWRPEKISMQMSILGSEPDVDLCVTLAQNFWSPDLGEQERIEDPRLTRPWVGYTCSALLARRSVFDEVGFFDTGVLVEDGEWFARVEQRGLRCTVVPEVLVLRRLHAANASRHRTEERLESFVRRAKAAIERYRATGAASRIPEA